MGWSETSDGIPIGLIDNSYGGAPSCSATVGTERGTLMVSHKSPNADGDACAQSEHYLRTIFTADGKDNYNGKALLADATFLQLTVDISNEFGHA